MEIAPNFFFPKGDPKGQDLTNRLLAWKALDRRTGDSSDPNDITPQKLLDMMRAARKLIYKLAEPRIVAKLMDNIKEVYPEVKLHGKDLKTLDDVVQYIQRGPYDNKIRGFVDYVLHSSWGTSNAWALEVEHDIMIDLEMKYSDKKIAPGKTPEKQKREKNHPGNFCKQMCVIKKGSMLNRIQLCVRRIYKEVIYRRGQDKERLLQSTPKPSIPKVVRLEPATRESHGFEGLVGICVGHKVLIQEENNREQMPPEPPDTDNKMVQWLTEQIKEGKTIETAGDLIRLLNENDHDDDDPLMDNPVAALLEGCEQEDEEDGGMVSACLWQLVLFPDTISN